MGWFSKRSAKDGDRMVEGLLGAVGAPGGNQWMMDAWRTLDVPKAIDMMLHDELPRRRKMAAISLKAVMSRIGRKVSRDEVRATAEAFVKALGDSDQDVTSYAKDGLATIGREWSKEADIVALVSHALGGK